MKMEMDEEDWQWRNVKVNVQAKKTGAQKMDGQVTYEGKKMSK